MNAFETLSSVNKISIIAFVITLGFLIFEFYLYQREGKRKEKIADIPNFNPDQKVALPTTGVINKENVTVRKSTLPMLITIVFFIFFTLLSLVGLTVALRPPQTKSQAAIRPKITILSSNGIRIFNTEWRVLTSKELTVLQPGNIVYIGLSTIDNPELKNEIHQARIRINETEWREDHVTKNFNSLYNVFYREYQIPLGTTGIAIQAQLHSQQSGWLGK